MTNPRPLTPKEMEEVRLLVGRATTPCLCCDEGNEDAGCICTDTPRYDKLATSCAALLATLDALTPYVQHKVWCNKVLLKYGDVPCDCGLDKVREGRDV